MAEPVYTLKPERDLQGRFWVFVLQDGVPFYRMSGALRYRGLAFRQDMLIQLGVAEDQARLLARMGEDMLSDMRAGLSPDEILA